MSAASRAGVAGAALAAAAVGAAAGLLAERTLVRRPLRRGGTTTERLGSLRGPHRVVTADDGVELYVEVDAPRRDGRWRELTVVFVHGYALNLDNWHYQRQALRGQARLVLYDQRSHGRSGRGPAGHATIEQLGADLARVVRATARGPVVLVGHSMGGMTVMALAQQHPEWFGERVVGVALMSTTPGRFGEITFGFPSPLARAAHRVAPLVVSLLGRQATLVERGRAVGSDLESLLTKVYSFGSDVPVEVVDFVVELLTGTSVDVLTEFFHAFAEHDRVDALPVLQSVETLVLVGRQDLLTPPDHSADIVRMVPGAEHVVLDPGGHMVMLERPTEVNLLLRELLDRAQRHVAAQRAADVEVAAGPGPTA